MLQYSLTKYRYSNSINNHTGIIQKMNIFMRTEKNGFIRPSLNNLHLLYRLIIFLQGYKTLYIGTEKPTYSSKTYQMSCVIRKLAFLHMRRQMRMSAAQ